MLKHLFTRETQQREALVAAQVVTEPTRCVQCGICSFNCPMGIDIRQHARAGSVIRESYCLTCGECVSRCPRGVLRFEHSSIFDPSDFIHE
jgi:Pyruvate/2-oxoacid:ferredoxin oxidoreductase delta subunit